MFCDKCGKQIPNGMKFCQYCGAQIGNVQQPDCQQVSPRPQQTQHAYPPPTTKTSVFFKGFSAFEILILAAMAIVALMWLIQGFSSFDDIRIELGFVELLEESMGVAGAILYWVPVVLILALELLGAIGLFRRRYIISTGALAFLIGFIMKVGGWIFNDYEMDTASVIAYYVFTPYSSVSGWTMFLGAIMTILLYVKANANQSM